MYRVYSWGVSPSKHHEFLDIKEAASLKYSSGIYKSNPLKAPLRVIRLLLLGIFLPSILVALPLYMRYHALREAAYSFAQSDMRLLEGRVSTAWCQTQTVRANGTFNAYLMPGRPEPEVRRRTINLVRDLTLTDDMKEYWGFYLLRGSAVTVSTCSRWPGASLIIIRGHQHLLECAYIGDESSEEMNEVRRVQIRQQLEYRHGLDTAATRKVVGKPAVAAVTQEPFELSTAAVPPPVHARPRTRTNNPPNNPEKMRMVQSEGVILHQDAPPSPAMYFAMDKSSQELDEPENSTEREIYEKRSMAADSAMTTLTQSLLNSVFGRAAPTTSPDEDSSEVLADVLRRLQHLGSRGSRVLKRLSEQAAQQAATSEPPIAEPPTAEQPTAEQPTAKPPTAEPPTAEPPTAEPPTAEQPTAEQPTAEPPTAEQPTAEQPTEPLANYTIFLGEVENTTEENRRERRHVNTAQSELHQQLNRHDDDMNTAIEDDSVGLDDIPINRVRADEGQTDSKDESHSEFWSSFSSSEEALLRCPGLVLNLPLTPHRSCQQKRPHTDLHHAAAANKVTYRVPEDGHYFFVFSSENEAQTNFIRAQFDMDRMAYDISRSKAYCKNSTEPCSLPLSFMSSESVVLDIPVGANDSLWNQHFVVYSTCEPRTGIYLVCLVSVPLVILFFAFQ